MTTNVWLKQVSLPENLETDVDYISTLTHTHSLNALVYNSPRAVINKDNVTTTCLNKLVTLLTVCLTFRFTLVDVLNNENIKGFYLQIFQFRHVFPHLCREKLTLICFAPSSPHSSKFIEKSNIGKISFL